MVSIVGGFISNTLWRVVSGDPHSGGRDSLPGGHLSGDPKRGHVRGCLNASHAHFVRKPITDTHNGAGGSPRLGAAHFCDGVNCGHREVRKQEYLGGINPLKEGELDWVMFDLTSVSSVPSVPSSRSSKGSSSTDLSTLRSPISSPSRIHASNSRFNFDYNECCLPRKLPCLDDVQCPPVVDRTDSHCPELSKQRKTLDRGAGDRTCPSVDQPNLSTHTADECQVKTLSMARNNVSNIRDIATPGNRCGSEDSQARPRQCVHGRQLSNLSTWSDNGAFCHACAMETTNDTKDKMMKTVTVGQGASGEAPLPPEPPPVSPQSPAVDNNKENIEADMAGLRDVAGRPSGGGRVGSSAPFVAYREDIRAYDIYQITPNVSTEAHYSRLPSALPALTDSDSDPDDAAARMRRQGVRRRKRKIPGRREGFDGRKRYREREGTDEDEEEEEEEGERMLGLDDVTVYTSPSLEDYTNRISILHRLSSTSNVQTAAAACGSSSSSSTPTTTSSTTVPSSSNAHNAHRRVSFSLSTSNPCQKHSSTDTNTSTNTSTTTTRYPKSPFRISSSTYGHSPGDPSSSTCTSKQPSKPPGNEEEDDVPSDNDNTLDNDDEDDDEASTVVPDDFDDETDSDIEVLAQSESWVDLSNQPEESPDRVTPLPFGNGEEYIRLLREAQRESNQSSARVSLASSRRDTPRDSPHDSPKSPPNSPNTELTTDPEEAVLKGVYINYYNKEGDFIRVEKNTETDWIWDWSSRPDQTPPKEWRFSHPGKGVNRGASIRRVMVGKSSLFSRDVLYTLLITNVLSLLIGTGIGIWLSKRSSSGAIVTLPIN